eukprot:TRINITY_DN7130_c0_g1_i3.p1 TRINITY_DN7130_c0_g1~~TRINITY_DN7130_c0_g1_i3.p1  ORF type:complete len:234 (+),score=-16.88 TRINITY_DN7130_c0_g1_i3:233-934(+)
MYFFNQHNENSREIQILAISQSRYIKINVAKTQRLTKNHTQHNKTQIKRNYYPQNFVVSQTKFNHTKKSKDNISNPKIQQKQYHIQVTQRTEIYQYNVVFIQINNKQIYYNESEHKLLPYIVLQKVPPKLRIYRELASNDNLHMKQKHRHQKNLIIHKQTRKGWPKISEKNKQTINQLCFTFISLEKNVNAAKTPIHIQTIINLPFVLLTVMQLILFDFRFLVEQNTQQFLNC